MILRWILDIILMIMSLIISSASDIGNANEMGAFMLGFFETLANYYQTAFNAIYWTLGTATYFYIDFAISYTLATYLIFPVITLIRRFFIKGGDD